MKFHTFTVQGNGEFPADMLRFDTCWPANGCDVIEAFKPLSPIKPRAVRLTGIRKPTDDRWRSFGWGVIA